MEKKGICRKKKYVVIVEIAVVGDALGGNQVDVVKDALVRKTGRRAEVAASKEIVYQQAPDVVNSCKIPTSSQLLPLPSLCLTSGQL
jgi:hypothetical protein